MQSRHSLAGMRNTPFHVAPIDLFIIICSYLNILESTEMCKIWSNYFIPLPSQLHTEASSYFLLLLHVYPNLISKEGINLTETLLLCASKQRIYNYFVFSTQQLWYDSLFSTTIILSAHCYLNPVHLRSCKFKYTVNFGENVSIQHLKENIAVV